MTQVSVSGWIVDSDVDAKTTMMRMARKCHDAMKNPKIIRYGNEIIGAVKPRDVARQIGAVNHFMDRWFRFVNNPVGVQLIRDPWSMITDIESRGFTQGACDDAAVLVATLGMANGIYARFRALAFHTVNDPYSHVITDLWDGQSWVSCDVTKPANMATTPTATRTLIVDV